MYQTDIIHKTEQKKKTQLSENIYVNKNSYILNNNQVRKKILAIYRFTLIIYTKRNVNWTVRKVTTSRKKIIFKFKDTFKNVIVKIS